MNIPQCAAVILVLSLAWPALVAGAEQTARTADGKDVILRDDGTWVYSLSKEKDAKPQYKGRRGNFALWLSPDKWKQVDAPDSPDAEIGFRNRANDVFCTVIVERIELAPDKVEKTVVDNVRAVDKDARVVRKDRRVVNGRELLCLTLEARIEGVSWTFHGYYYTGRGGTIQVVTAKTSNAFADAKPEMEAFLNGLEVTDK